MIPNKEISKSDFLQLIHYQKITSGGEATICESDTPFSMYKIFTLSDKPKPMEETKIQKISSLYDMKVQHSVQPISTISLHDVIIGYEMTSDIGLVTAPLEHLPPDEQKYFLSQTKKILEYFTTRGIIYGDIDARNILFNRNTGEIQFCDMDNIVLDGIPMELKPGDVRYYEAVRPIDDGLHPYMHNLMTLRALGIDTYWATKLELRKHFKRPAVKTIQSMKDPSNFNNEYVIQYLKK